MITDYSSELHDARLVPYIECTIHGLHSKPIVIKFNYERWKLRQENMTANRGLPMYDTTAGCEDY